HRPPLCVRVARGLTARHYEAQRLGRAAAHRRDVAGQAAEHLEHTVERLAEAAHQDGREHQAHDDLRAVLEPVGDDRERRLLGEGAGMRRLRPPPARAEQRRDGHDAAATTWSRSPMRWTRYAAREKAHVNAGDTALRTWNERSSPS